MIDQKYTRIFDGEQRQVETAAFIADEGQALVFVKEGLDTVVRPSTGVAGEVFAGIAQARNVAPLFVPFVYEGVISPAGIELPRLPIAGQILVSIAGNKATIGAGTPAAAGAVKLDGSTVTFHAADNGKEVFIQFMYEPTVNEARQFKGDVAVGGLSVNSQGVVGVITRGDVATSFYDASVDWSGALTVNLGADGKFTVGGTGVQLSNVTVLKSPAGGNPLLVLRVGL